MAEITHTVHVMTNVPGLARSSRLSGREDPNEKEGHSDADDDEYAEVSGPSEARGVFVDREVEEEDDSLATSRDETIDDDVHVRAPLEYGSE